MKHLKKFENYTKFDDYMKNINQKKKEYIPFEEEPKKDSESTEIATETPIDVKPDENRGYGFIYPEELEDFGTKGLEFYKYILSQDDGPVDEFIATMRAFRYVGSDKTPDGSTLYTIKNPVKKQEVEMAANVYQIAIKTIQEEGGKLPTNEPVGEYEKMKYTKKY